MKDFPEVIGRYNCQTAFGPLLHLLTGEAQLAAKHLVAFSQMYLSQVKTATLDPDQAKKQRYQRQQTGLQGHQPSSWIHAGSCCSQQTPQLWWSSRRLTRRWYSLATAHQRRWLTAFSGKYLLHSKPFIHGQRDNWRPWRVLQAAHPFPSNA